MSRLLLALSCALALASCGKDLPQRLVDEPLDPPALFGSCVGEEIPECAAPIADGCPPEDGERPPDDCGPAGQGNGFDDNCNGRIDEDCTGCVPNQVQACFPGPAALSGVGQCRMGTQVCRVGDGNRTAWGPCTGAVAPSREQCDDLDNDCNGCEDDGLCCQQGVLRCPESGEVPEIAPFRTHRLDGTEFFTGAAREWRWEIEGSPCDQLYLRDGGTPTFELSDAADAVARFTPTLSGDYRIKLTVKTIGNDTLRCEWIQHVGGDGLRVELCWDTEGNTDIDLHLHRPGSTADWFGAPDRQDDCYYANCTAANWALAAWGLGTSPIEECRGAPGGTHWEDRFNHCKNPRLDVDNVRQQYRPENINVDRPADGTYRVMVNFFSVAMPPDSERPNVAATRPLVNIYCNGHLRSRLGDVGDRVSDFETAGGDGEGDIWRVADVAWAGSDCTIRAFRTRDGGYWVTQGGDKSYGEPPPGPGEEGGGS